MALIAIWLVSIEERAILFRRYFPNNGTKSSDGKIIAMLTMKEEDQFVAGLMESLGLDSSIGTGDENDQQETFNFDCTQINQLPALGFKLMGHKIWPIIVLEHKGILFCGLPVINNSSTNLIDHIGVSVAVSTLQVLINHFSKDSRLYSLEEYFTKNMPFGYLITNPYEIEDDGPKTRTSGIANSSTNSKQDLVLTIRVTEFISSSESGVESIHGTVYLTNNIALSSGSHLTYKVDNLPDLNVILSPHCWLTSNGTEISSKLDSKAFRYFHYKCSPSLGRQPFLKYTYRLNRKLESLFNLDLSIEVQSGHSLRFHTFKVNFSALPTEFISRLSNCNPSQGQLHMDKLSGFYWIVGTRFPKNGRIRLTADLACSSISANLLDASCNFRVDNYSHGFPKIRNDSLAVTNLASSVNFKLSPQLTLATFDYRLKPVFV